MIERAGLFVIEGVDGAGKETQANLTYNHVVNDLGRSAIKDHFPHYGEPSAEIVEAYLGGKYGDLMAVPPQFVAQAFAIDRRAGTYAAEEYLDADPNNIVIFDRYTASNVAHHGGKFEDRHERHDFFRWAFRMEREDLRMPKPKQSVILFVPPEVTINNIIERGEPKDLHESNLDYQRRVAEAYQEVYELFPDEFTPIDCMNMEGKMRSREDIQADIRTALKINALQPSLGTRLMRRLGAATRWAR